MKKQAKRRWPFAVRKSSIHGRGVFATRPIAKGERLIEYTGERITWQEAERRYPIDPVPYHTFLFEVGDGTMCIDAVRKANAAKWINHSCRPNCEAAEDEDERIFIEAARAIRRGEELPRDDARQETVEKWKNGKNGKNGVRVTFSSSTSLPC